METGMNVGIPEGFEETGEYRRPKKGEAFLNDKFSSSIARHGFSLAKVIILRKKEPESKLKKWRYPPAFSSARMKSHGDIFTMMCIIDDNLNLTRKTLENIQKRLVRLEDKDKSLS